MQAQPAIFKAWYGEACNSTGLGNITATTSHSTFENVDPVPVLVALVTGLAMLALISLSVLFSRYRKRNVVVVSLQSSIKNASRDRLEMEASNQARDLELADLKRSLAKAQQMVVKAMESEESMLKPFSITFSELDLGASLGEGAFGTVLKGVLRGNIPVAVKTLRVTKLTSEVLNKFKQELKVRDARLLLSSFAACELTSLSPCGLVFPSTGHGPTEPPEPRKALWRMLERGPRQALPRSRVLSHGLTQDAHGRHEASRDVGRPALQPGSRHRAVFQIPPPRT